MIWLHDAAGVGHDIPRSLTASLRSSEAVRALGRRTWSHSQGGLRKRGSDFIDAIGWAIG
jgi:hypothetical protein